MKIRPEGAELFHAVGWTANRYDEGNSPFSQNFEYRLLT